MHACSSLLYDASFTCVKYARRWNICSLVVHWSEITNAGKRSRESGKRVPPESTWRQQQRSRLRKHKCQLILSGFRVNLICIFVCVCVCVCVGNQVGSSNWCPDPCILIQSVIQVLKDIERYFININEYIQLSQCFLVKTNLYFHKYALKHYYVNRSPTIFQV